MIPHAGPRRPFAAVLLALLALLLVAPAASAVAPFRLSGQITDQVGALEGKTDEVQKSIDHLSSSKGIDLWVVFVSSFDGASGQEWAQQTAQASGLGPDQVLLAVATTDRAYGLYADPGSPNVSQSDLDAAGTAARQHLADEDWAGAAEATTDSLGGGGSSGSAWIWVVIFLAVVVVVVLLVVQSRRGRRIAERARADAAANADPDSPEALAVLSTPDLTKRSSSALVAIDDAVKSSEQELGFAQAQFGEVATQEFQTTLDDAKAKVQQAFTLRQRLDDDQPETEPQARAMMVQIVGLCRAASDAMRAQAAKFEELRQLEARAPEVLDEIEQKAGEIAARIDPARTTLTDLAASYPPVALASVVRNPDQATALLSGARATVATARDDLAKNDRASAVVRSRAAATAVDQARTLLDAVDHASTDLATAGARIDSGVASISSDLADAQRLAPTDAGVLAAVGPAQAAVTGAHAARDGGDPLAAVSALTSAEAALDAALEPFREKAEQDARAKALLVQTLGRVGSQVRAVSEFIDTRRGAVGPEARTRLAEATRLLQQATTLQVSDPQQALAAAQQAEQYATSAQQIAQRDTEDWSNRQGGGRGGGSNVGGMILGGILIDSILRGGGGMGGGWGGGGGFGGGGGGGGGGGSTGGRF